MRLQPVTGEAQRLRALQDVTDDVRGEEGQMDHVLDPALRGAGIGGDLLEAPPFLDGRHPRIRPGDIADQGMIELARRLAEHQPGFDAAPPQPEGMGQVKLLRLQSIGGKPESRREGRGVESDGQCVRSNRRPLHQNRGAIDGARLPAGKLVRQTPQAHPARGRSRWR